jgi:phosphotransferase system IIA component
MGKSTKKTQPRQCGACCSAILQAVVVTLAICLFVTATVRVLDTNNLRAHPLNLYNMCDAVFPRGCYNIDSNTVEFSINRAIITGNKYEVQYVIMETHAYNCSAQQDLNIMRQIGCIDTVNVETLQVVPARVNYLKRINRDDTLFDWIVISLMYASSIAMVVITAIFIEKYNTGAVQQNERTQLLTKV